MRYWIALLILVFAIGAFVVGEEYIKTTERIEIEKRMELFLGKEEMKKLGENATEYEAILRWAELNENWGRGVGAKW